VTSIASVNAEEVDMAIMSMTADGAYLAAGMPDCVAIHHRRTGVMHKLAVEDAAATDFAPNTSTLGVAAVARSEKQRTRTACVILVDAKSGKEMARCPIRHNGLRVEPIGAACFSGDGKLFAVGSASGTGSGGLISVYRVSSNSIMAQLETSGAVVSVSFARDHKTIFAGTCPEEGCGGALVYWDLGSLRQRTITDGHPAAIYAVAPLPGGHTVVTGGGMSMCRGSSSRMCVCQMGDGRLCLNLFENEQHCITRLWASPDGSVLASGDSEGRVLLWNIPEMKIVGRLRTSGGEVKWIGLIYPVLLVAGSRGTLSRFSVAPPRDNAAATKPSIIIPEGTRRQIVATAEQRRDACDREAFNEGQR
jgi:WD domain, G-beta repeat